MGIHRQRGATPQAPATPMRPQGSGGVAPSASLPLLRDGTPSRRCGASRPTPRRSERGPTQYPGRLLGLVRGKAVLVLGIDTATTTAGLALARPGSIVREESLSERAHARDLLIRLEGVLTATDLTVRDLRGIGVTLGPGSFIGVRIGMATAKGLAYALDVPLVGLSTLEALAHAALRAARTLPHGVLAVLDAGRGEVYAARFRFAGAVPERIDEDRSWRPADLLRALPADMPVIGNGARTLAPEAAATGRGLEVVHSGPPLAAVVALHAAGTIRPGQAYRPGTLRPNYIRPFDAEAAGAQPRKV